MNIPQNYQIFDEPVVFGPKDEVRLSVYLTGWPKLAGLLISGVNEPDLRRLVIMELMGRKRKAIIDRLLMRLGRLEREKLKKKVYSLL